MKNYNDNPENDFPLSKKFPFEPFTDLISAAKALGLPHHTIQRGTRSGVFPSYRFGRRLRVRLSEIVAVIEATRRGGAQ